MSELDKISLAAKDIVEVFRAHKLKTSEGIYVLATVYAASLVQLHRIMPRNVVPATATFFKIVKNMVEDSGVPFDIRLVDKDGNEITKEIT